MDPAAGMTEPAATTPSPAEMDRRDWLNLGGLLFVLFATRIVWIVWNPDATLYWEEDYRWVAAREILSGPVQPIFDYQADNYQGGSLVMIGLITSLFAVFGESLLVLKLAPLLFAGATLATLYILARLWFGQPAALIAGVGYVVGPSLLAHSALIPMGSHGESALFSLLQVACFLGIQSRRWNTLPGWAVLGFIFGFGLWFCFTSGLSLAACGVTWLILEGVPKAKQLLSALAGAAVGLVPWLVYNLQNDFSGTLRLLEVFGARDSIDAWAARQPVDKFVDLILRDLPIGLLDPFQVLGHPLASAVLQVSFCLPVAIALTAGLIRVAAMMGAGPRTRAANEVLERQRSELVFYVYALVFTVAYLGSSFDLEQGKGAHAYRLLLPLAILMWIPTAYSLSRAFTEPGVAKNVAMLGLVLTGVSCTASTIMVATRAPEDRQTGGNIMEHVYGGNLVRGVLLHRKYEEDLAVAYVQARRVPDLKERFRVFQGIGWGIEYRFEGSGEITPFLSDVDDLEFGEQVAVLAGLIWTTGNRVSELEEAEANGTATIRDGDQLNRLKKLKSMLQKQWRRLPEPYKQADYVIY